MLVKKNITISLDKNTEAVKRFDMTFELITGHHCDCNFDPFLTCLVQELILDIKWCFAHIHSLSAIENVQLMAEFYQFLSRNQPKLLIFPF